METSVMNLLLQGLATWYVSYALTSTHGPGHIFARIRESVWHGRTRKIVELNSDPKLSKWEYDHDGLLDCPVCLAFWAALILLLVPMGVVVQALALAGGAMLLHSFAGWRFGGG